MTRRQILAHFKRFDPSGIFYRWDEVLGGVCQDHPEWTPEACQAETERVFRTLLRLESRWYYAQKRYHAHVTSWADVDHNTAA